MRKRRRTSALVLVLWACGAAVLIHQLPSLAAGGLLYPLRVTGLPPPPDGCEEREFAGAGVWCGRCD